MALVRRSPTRALRLLEPVYRPMSLIDEIEQMARDIWDLERPVTLTRFTHPVDMYEEKDGLVIKAELPGITKEDLDIKLEGDMLTIKAEKKADEVPEDTSYFTCERWYGQYTRSLSLPFPVKAEKVSATFENGILEIRLPKTKEVKGKHIEIKVK